jgi:signal transduction histidine kinase
MKMRFWQRTYVFTLALFLVCLNVGILSLTVYTYHKNVEATETAASAEQYYIAKSFERDYEDMEQSSAHASPSLLMLSFGTYYKSKGLCLAFKEGGEVVYTSFPSDVQVEKGTLAHIDLYADERHVLISSEICAGKYEMIFAKNVSYLDTELRALIITYALTALGVSLILAVCLYFILKKLSAPLEELRKTTALIEAGDFSVTAKEQGDDEFTLLAKSFNAMLAKINEQMAALEREAEKKQMLVDNMAHELRTPLTSIRGYAEFIERANTTEERRLIAAKYIVSEAERLGKISEILLDGAVIRENEMEASDVDLGAVLSDVAEKLQMRAEKVGVEIVCDTAPVVVWGNETLLSMLFYNLTENAIKACASGGRVRLSCADAGAIVEDNGKGMSEEQLLHVTEPFYRTDKARSRAEGGAGLGLALCKQIVGAHGANMRFESRINEGTKIFVTFTTRQ